MLFEDPQWRRASAWLQSGHGDRAALGVVGLPVNRSITPGRCDLAPAAIRDALIRFSLGDLTLGGCLEDLPIHDYGDVSESDHALAKILATHEACVILGGDNGVTPYGVKALNRPLHSIGLLTIDAHFDLRDVSLGVINGNPVRRLLADGLPGENIVQIGLQSFANSDAYATVAREAGIAVFTAEKAHDLGMETCLSRALGLLESRCEVIYVDLDLDVMDMAFAPGCPGARPGGITPLELRRAARTAGLHPMVKALDVVELDPMRDVRDQTSLTAAACLLEFAAGLRQRLEAQGT